MNRVYNFSAGPSALPLSVLETAAKELVSYGSAGMSVMEMSHRSADYQAIIDETEALLRELMNIPSNYKVLFLQGGASTQFAMVPFNLMTKTKKAEFINTGAWSKKAIAEAKKHGDVVVTASSEDKTFSYIPDYPPFSKDIDFAHITTNNTIYGTKFSEIPDTGDVPLVADMSSNILSEAIDVTKFGIIYAGAQKNLGPAGVTIVIIREDLVGKHKEDTPTMLKYETHVKSESMFNTPPCYPIYMVGLVLKWLKGLGGVTAVEKMNKEKAEILYSYLETSELFSSPIVKKDRSLMNVPFVTGDAEIDKKFIAQAGEKGFVNLKGHRSVGGMRASIYNAMPKEGVQALVDFMKEFEKENK